MNEAEVITQAAARLRGQGAHVPFDDAVDGIPFDLVGEAPHGLPHSIWQLAEHIRIGQRDILDYTKDPSVESPPWPEGYWPQGRAPESEDAWNATLAAIRKDREELIGLLEEDPTRMLEGTEHSVLREVLIAAAHSSYHTGQIVMLRRLLDAWD